MKWQRQSLMLVLFLFILSSLCYGQPFPAQESDREIELQILFPKFEVLKLNNDFQFNIHVFNASGIRLDNITTDCYLHIYNSSGQHIIREKMLFDSEDFYLDIGGNNFSEVSSYAFNVWCNNTVEQGGFSSKEVLITTSGVIYENNYQEIALILMFIIIFMFFIGWKFKVYYFDFEIGQETSSQPVLMYLFWLIGGWLVIALLNVAIAASKNLTVILDNTLSAVYSAVLWPMYILTAFFLIGIMFAVLQWLGQKTKELK